MQEGSLGFVGTGGTSFASREDCKAAGEGGGKSVMRQDMGE